MHVLVQMSPWETISNQTALKCNYFVVVKHMVTSLNIHDFLVVFCYWAFQLEHLYLIVFAENILLINFVIVGNLREMS